MNTRKFWCHYIGSDGNTPKRRNIELTDISQLLPISNEGVKTPVWYEHDDGYYILYAQLSDKVAVMIRNPHALNERLLKDYLLVTDKDIDREYEERMASIYSEENLKYTHMTEERIAECKAAWRKSYDDRKKYRDARFADLRHFQDYDDYLLSGSVWITTATIRAYEEVLSPYLPVLQELRRQALEQREEEAKAGAALRRKAIEWAAAKKAEAEAKEQERLTQEAEKFKQGESISGSDVVDLCRRHGIAIHLRTVHNLQQVIANINGKNGTCQYYRQRGKRTTTLDGCYKTARQLYDYLQAH